MPWMVRRVGGLVNQRHKEVRDALGDIVAMAYKEVIGEREANVAARVPSLLANLRRCEGCVATID